MTQQLTRQDPSTWVERLARFGYAAKGVVYGIVGLLAAQAAFGAGGKTTDTEGALQTVLTQPFGKFLLAAIALGLLGYALWRFVQAIKDPEHKGTNAKGIFQRLGYAINGFIYAGLAFTAIQLVAGTGGGSGGNATQDWTARLLSQPFGQWLVGTVGAFIIGMGFYQFYRAFKAKFRQEMDLHQLSETEKKWVLGISGFGTAARGVVFCAIGFFLIQAARNNNPNEARGLGEALQVLSQQPFGKWILGIVALGLIAYSIYMVLQARYRRLKVD
ncbi:MULTISPECIES: DUF1206 domain-containing protein [Chroococcidiopsis]|jgi:uncharacterized membrane protein YidH (DUF202 family)|uniref:DUF1206 domain-containing protein n=1 Tax=Chroococcidiopsis thermalis (strain PCC 7203) TaxID=251229 RepID=K9U6Q2_CHRTP|nr:MULTISPECIES: DUF1206 domain-containing protein [Chroococcidiopsis]MBE9018490.1 DUF1206 domain-containing protein [Chroococcidiopsidales cyanobacterium LEGE 13417]PSB43333.1 DUF1206 domain-containing protein [Cyanosarcina cf. burmensis CCALA 770]AFY90515.1 protein of unknown function DUF1206 [Chroococcidiopsis thermalis PCC 7203]PSM49746.1 DUF1206 domain-containing protein [Chroococcidiopsis sp. CCALA 051]URD50027.1 DUF1206 domain-containing protein [Chroococcidiopsis sp. CCNUC1]